jgi:DNA-binding CsgD family transcriptional regulator
MGNPLDSLSPRERELLGYVREGCSNREAANLLGISVKTVQTHRAKINGKLGVHSPTQLLVTLLRLEEEPERPPVARIVELPIPGAALQRLLRHFRVRNLPADACSGG